MTDAHEQHGPRRAPRWRTSLRVNWNGLTFPDRTGRLCATARRPPPDLGPDMLAFLEDLVRCHTFPDVWRWNEDWSTLISVLEFLLVRLPGPPLTTSILDRAGRALSKMLDETGGIGEAFRPAAILATLDRVQRTAITEHHAAREAARTLRGFETTWERFERESLAALVAGSSLVTGTEDPFPPENKAGPPETKARTPETVPPETPPENKAGPPETETGYAERELRRQGNGCWTVAFLGKVARDLPARIGFDRLAQVLEASGPVAVHNLAAVRPGVHALRDVDEAEESEPRRRRRPGEVDREALAVLDAQMVTLRGEIEDLDEARGEARSAGTSRPNLENEASSARREAIHEELKLLAEEKAQVRNADRPSRAPRTDTTVKKAILEALDTLDTRKDMIVVREYLELHLTWGKTIGYSGERWTVTRLPRVETRRR